MEGGPTEVPTSDKADNLLFLPRSKVAAVVLMGDPSWVNGTAWNAGTADSGVSYFPRRNSGACAPVADKMVSYCDANDEYCNSGTSIVIHASYLTRYTSDAYDFVAGLVGDDCS